MILADHEYRTSGQAAKFLGHSMSEFKRRLALGYYPPDKISVKGWRLYKPASLERFKRERGSPFLESYTPPTSSPPAVDPKSSGEAPTLPTVHPTNGYDAATAKIVMTEFNNGKNPADVVVEHGVHPLQVRAIHQVWAELRGLITLTSEQVDRINALKLDGEFPVETGEQLVKNLEEMERKESPVCVQQACRGAVEAHAAEDIAKVAKKGKK